MCKKPPGIPTIFLNQRWEFCLPQEFLGTHVTISYICFILVPGCAIFLSLILTTILCCGYYCFLFEDEDIRHNKVKKSA